MNGSNLSTRVDEGERYYDDHDHDMEDSGMNG